jgi:hypothetical protein
MAYQNRRPRLRAPGTQPGHSKRLQRSATPVGQFLSAVGCINPATKLAGPEDDIDFVDSRTRVIAIMMTSSRSSAPLCQQATAEDLKRVGRHPIAVCRRRADHRRG